jgi:hypothetical protein
MTFRAVQDRLSEQDDQASDDAFGQRQVVVAGGMVVEQ